MQEYQYKIFDEKGKIHTGKIQALDYSDAEKLLKKNNWNLIQLKSRVFKFPFLSSLPAEEEIFFYIQFSSLLSAQVPLLRSLEITACQIKNICFKKALKESIKDLKKGISLSESFRKHERYFNTFTLGMIEAGEESGKLENIFHQLSLITEQKHEFRQDLTNALSYPLLLFVLSLVFAFLIMFFVYPRFLEIFSESNISLPFSTLLLARTVEFFCEKGLWVFMSVIALGIFSINYFGDTEGKLHFDHFTVKIPVAGEIIKVLLLQRLFFNMSLLLKAEVPPLKTIELLAKTITHDVITSLLADVWVNLRRGGSMSEAVQGHHEIPTLVHQILRTGEETGNVEELLDKMSDYYKTIIRIKLKRIHSILEPLLLSGLGVLIAFLLSSLLLPMFRIVKTLR